MKRRVIGFFVVLVLLAVVLTVIRFFVVDSSSSFNFLNDAVGNPRIPNVSFEDREGVVFGFLLLVFVFIFAFIMLKFEKRRHKMHVHLINDERPFKRKLIPVRYE